MIDASTSKPLFVSIGGTAGPYIMVPVVQLEVVRTLLDSAKIPFWVDEDVISLNGEPEVAVINIARGIDVKAVQDLLDNTH